MVVDKQDRSELGDLEYQLQMERLGKAVDTIHERFPEENLQSIVQKLELCIKLFGDRGFIRYEDLSVGMRAILSYIRKEEISEEEYRRYIFDPVFDSPILKMATEDYNSKSLTEKHRINTGGVYDVQLYLTEEGKKLLSNKF